MNNAALKPKKRSTLRLFVGSRYFTIRRYLLWLFGGRSFARIRNEQLPFLHFSHSTPLLRKLKDVDMYWQYNKVANLQIALKKVHNVVLLPGETFSYWKLIGKPTKGKGYKKGLVLQNGLVKEGTGGGLCQLSNLLFWITLHTPLTVVERHRHSYDVFPDSNRSQPFGSGATCFYNYGDLMIENNTEQKFQLCLTLSETELSACWRADYAPTVQYSVYEKEHFFRLEYWGGYTRHNVLCRKTFEANGALLDDEFLVENHAVTMYAPFLSEPAP